MKPNPTRQSSSAKLAQSAPPAGSRPDDAGWAAVERRDPAFDGSLYYAVLTTGIYCRPSCPARRPQRANVVFYATPAAAEQAGFRSCKRCSPREHSLHDRRAAHVADACRRIDASEGPPSLRELAAAAGLSPHYFHRLFRSLTGVTPKTYALTRRRQRLDHTLTDAATITAAALDAGYPSAASFYADAGASLGMTPKQRRAGGAGTTLQYAVGRCTLGAVLAAATHKGIAAILLGDDPDALRVELARRFPRATLLPASADFAATLSAVVELIDNPAKPCALPLDIRGTAFQQRVWQALRDIPAGTTATYADVAARVGSPAATRAVASACAANAHAVAIPCHRVIRGDGSLSGYRWGLERKRRLLEREAAGQTKRNPNPKRKSR